MTNNLLTCDEIGHEPLRRSFIKHTGSGSFAIGAAKIDPRMKAIVTVSIYDMGAANRPALNKPLTLAQHTALIAEAARQRDVDFGGGQARYTSGTVQEITERSHPIEREFQVWMTIGGAHRFAVTLEDNPTARAFAQLLPLTLDMSDLNGNERHVRLARDLPANAARPGTIHTGDVMRHGDTTLVVFYKTFRSDYGRTRIGRVSDVTGLAQALQAGAQRIGFAGP